MFFSDWDHEEPAELYIERIDGPGGPRIADTHSVARRLNEVADFVEGSAKLWTEFTLGRRPSLYNTLTAPAAAGGMQRSSSQRYGAGHFVLSEDEALLIEFEPPDALHWNFELGDFWQRSLDFANRPISINDEQAVVDSDGIVRLVVSARDSVLANWLDTTGIREGPMTYRWNGAKSYPHPRTRLIRLDQLDREAPRHAVRVSSTQRTVQIEARRGAAQRRFQRG